MCLAEANEEGRAAEIDRQRESTRGERRIVFPGPRELLNTFQEGIRC